MILTMEGPSRSEFNALKEQNNQMMKLILQMKEDMERKYETNPPSQLFGIGDSFTAAQTFTHKEQENDQTEPLDAAQQMLPSHHQGQWF